jgi:hypothetical protein
LSFRGREHLSKPFRLEIEFTSAKAGIAMADVLGKPAKFMIQTIDPEAGADEYLFQCQDESTSEENVNWVVIQKHDSIIGLNYGRLVSKRFMLDNSRGEIPGKFGATTLCEPASAGKILPSNFILLRKRPINGDSPYCYDITYLVIKNGELNVEINNGNVKDGDPRYFLPPVSSVERSNLNKLLHEILMWISRQS